MMDARELRWHHRFLDLAEYIAEWSKDPSSKVGAVIVDSTQTILSTGYNGFPRHTSDDHRYHIREEKYEIVVHAETNAIAAAARIGITLSSAILYVSMHPCSRCVGQIIQAGLTRVLVPTGTIKEHWEQNCSLATKLLEEAAIPLIQIDRGRVKQRSILNPEAFAFEDQSSVPA